MSQRELIFWLMILLCEIAGMFKNSRLKDVLAWIMGLRAMMPYKDQKYFEHLLKKGSIDSTSEIFGGFCAFFLVFGENYSIENGPNLYTVTNTIESDTVDFYYTQCATACIGYHVKYDTAPTIHSLEKAGFRSFWPYSVEFCS
ncbi:hypothetical protein TL16_g00340 [Triparma laevis f. inornata]|uniref:LAGLIDADG homing endonuclease n=1 Tax=Triparma laevis f. inornata TaxID=1714386 RepID=A0A9W7DMM3_9STRA|nr:hypothetical protein TL16_g00340 [Triparma laevis f. inornata]